MTSLQALSIILAIAAATFLTRALPFIVFSEKRPVPDAVRYLGRVLPPAMAGLLIVYCLKDVSFLPSNFAWRELSSLVAIAGLHAWKRNAVLSVMGGTAAYMLLVWVF